MPLKSAENQVKRWLMHSDLCPKQGFFFVSFIFFSIFDNSQQCQYSTNIAAYKKSQDPSTQYGFINMLHLESQEISQSQAFTA